LQQFVASVSRARPNQERRLNHVGVRRWRTFSTNYVVLAFMVVDHESSRAATSHWIYSTSKHFTSSEKLYRYVRFVVYSLGSDNLTVESTNLLSRTHHMYICHCISMQQVKRTISPVLVAVTCFFFPNFMPCFSSAHCFQC
jgi:predicted SprT family Zn-dependent metalloprotease